jgi:hypothetical protein
MDGSARLVYMIIFESGNMFIFNPMLKKGWKLSDAMFFFCKKQFSKSSLDAK